MFKNLKKKIGLGLVAITTATFFMSSNAYAFTGIDISSCNWDNSRINFNSVKNDGVEAVIIKSTEGTSYIDPYLNENYWGSKNAGIPLGFYHFFSERTSPTQQAIDFWNAIKDKEYQITPVLDVETNSYDRSSYEVTNRCLEFLQKFKELSGQDCMIYTGGYFGLQTLDFRVKGYKAWIAHYGVSSPMYTGFSNVVGHQYSESSRVDGISGNVDMNNFSDGIFLNSVNIPVTPSQVDNNDNNSIDPIEQAKEFIGSRCGELQGLLIAKGYDCGGYGVDNEFGQGTYNSLVQFQKDVNLVPDGLCGDLTWAKLYETQSSASGWISRLQSECNRQGFSNQTVDNISGSKTLNGCPTLKQGSKGNITKLLQEKLNSLGYDCGENDGIFGSKTANSVYRYQIDNNLSGDKITGKRTWSKLLGLS